MSQQTILTQPVQMDANELRETLLDVVGEQLLAEVEGRSATWAKSDNQANIIACVVAQLPGLPKIRDFPAELVELPHQTAAELRSMLYPLAGYLSQPVLTGLCEIWEEAEDQATLIANFARFHQVWPVMSELENDMVSYLSERDDWDPAYTASLELLGDEMGWAMFTCPPPPA